MQLKLRHSIVFLPAPLLMGVVFALGLLIATFLLPSDHWRDSEIVVGALCALALIDCLVRCRWCTYRDHSIYFYSLEKRSIDSTSDSFITLDQNRKTKIYKWASYLLDLLPQNHIGGGLNLEPWEIIIHTNKSVYSLGMIYANNLNKNLTDYADTLHLPINNSTVINGTFSSIKNDKQAKIDDDEQIEQSLVRFIYRMILLFGFWGIVLLVILLLERQH